MNLRDNDLVSRIPFARIMRRLDSVPSDRLAGHHHSKRIGKWTFHYGVLDTPITTTLGYGTMLRDVSHEFQVYRYSDCKLRIWIKEK